MKLKIYHIAREELIIKIPKIRKLSRAQIAKLTPNSCGVQSHNSENATNSSKADEK